MIKESYRQQVSLLLDIMPIIAKEPQFAIHGGTAINLFEMDMPRLSVDVDLTFIPFTEDREDDFLHIRQGLINIKEGIQVNLSDITFPDAKRADEELKLFCLRENTVVKIEVNQINRGLIANTRVLLEWGINHKEVNSIIAKCDKSNVASHKTIIKLGFKYIEEESDLMVFRYSN